MWLLCGILVTGGAHMPNSITDYFGNTLTQEQMRVGGGVCYD